MRYLVRGSRYTTMTRKMLLVIQKLHEQCWNFVYLAWRISCNTVAATKSASSKLQKADCVGRRSRTSYLVPSTAYHSPRTNYLVPSTSYHLPHTRGFTIIEILVTIFIISTVITGIFGLFILSLRGAQTAERRVVAIALANERMEMVRNLPYLDVGTQGGVPSGSILQSETITRNDTPYTVTTDIRYVDDPYDGLITDGIAGHVAVCHSPPGNPGGQNTLLVGDNALQAHLNHGDTAGPCPGDADPTGADGVNTDYKQVRVSVDWPSQYNISPVLLITHISPQGVEGGDASGTLDFTALDAAGVAVAGATIHLVNESADPAIDLTTVTNSLGRVILPGLPIGSQVYELSVTKDDYTTEQTYDETADFIPHPDYGHLSTITREVTVKTFSIDALSSLTFTTQVSQPPAAPVLAPNIVYTLRGTKTIGVDGDSIPVVKVVENVNTGADATYQHLDLDWDSYTITIDGAATGYDIKETSLVMPLVVNPGDDLEVQVILVDHTPLSLQVTIVDINGAPIDNATVQLTGNGYDEFRGTGAWGQVLFEDLPVAGDYSVTVEVPGFTTVSEQPVTVDGTSFATITVTL